MKEFKIETFASYFHDGVLISVERKVNELVLSMVSSQIHAEDHEEEMPLSSDFCLKGELHIVNPLKIIENKNNQISSFGKGYDQGDIFSLEIKGNNIELVVEWIKFLDESFEGTDFFTYNISCKELYWTPVLNLTKPII